MPVPPEHAEFARRVADAGRADPIVPHESIERLAEILRAGGADVTLDWQPAGHGLTNADVMAARHWLAV